MTTETECVICGIEFEVVYDEIVSRDGIEVRYCPFCGTDQENEKEILTMFDDEDLEESNIY
jgi:uncharacterized protein CbrC (UPF0167 family)